MSDETRGTFSADWITPTKPIDMILHCPLCGVQHVDLAKECTMGVGCREAGVCYAKANDDSERCDKWDNPPHRSHLCAQCGNVWRPADVATNGVASIATRGERDTWTGETAAYRIHQLERVLALDPRDDQQRLDWLSRMMGSVSWRVSTANPEQIECIVHWCVNSIYRDHTDKRGDVRAAIDAAMLTDYNLPMTGRVSL